MKMSNKLAHKVTKDYAEGDYTEGDTLLVSKKEFKKMKAEWGEGRGEVNGIDYVVDGQFTFHGIPVKLKKSFNDAELENFKLKDDDKIYFTFKDKSYEYEYSKTSGNILSNLNGRNEQIFEDANINKIKLFEKTLGYTCDSGCWPTVRTKKDLKKFILALEAKLIKKESKC